MPIRTGTSFQIERRPRDLGLAPGEAYLMLNVAGFYVPGSGDKKNEADAYLSDLGSSVFVLDSDSIEEDRTLYQVSATEVMI